MPDEHIKSWDFKTLKNLLKCLYTKKKKKKVKLTFLEPVLDAQNTKIWPGWNNGRTKLFNPYQL